ncbi:extracellular solute-binding protein, partial [Streptomyces griseiscabiei]
SSDGGGGGKTKITLGLFGTAGFEESGLYKEYEKLNPDIDIEQTVVERNENYYPALLNHLTTGSGLQDIQMIEVGNIAEIVQTQSDKLLDLSKYGKKSDYLEWKWQQATTSGGQTIAVGTDVGPMAICYRKDL